MYPEKEAYQIAVIKSIVIKTIMEDIISKAERGEMTKKEADKIAYVFKKEAEDYLDSLQRKEIITDAKDRKKFNDHILNLIRNIRKNILKKSKDKN